MKKLKRAISLLLAISVLALANFVVFAVKENDTTTGMRMQPLIEKYNNLTDDQLKKELAKYSDSTNHWGKNYITKISALEIISGYGNGKFGPNDTLLSGQYILMLVRTIGFRPEVPEGTPYYKPFVNIAIQEGILKTGEIKDFTKPISRELAASLARRTVGLYEAVPTDYFVPGVDREGKGDKGFFDNVYVGYQKTKMSDFLTITNSRLQDVIDCYRIGLLTGNNNKFNPKGNLTRAEAAVIIIKLLDKTARVESVPSANEKFTYANKPSMDIEAEYCSDETGYYCNKEYTLYKGSFPLMEIWDTVNAMNKYKDKVSGGACNFGFNEKDKGFSMGWFINTEIEEKYRLDNWNGLIVPLNEIAVWTYKTSLKKSEQSNIYDNTRGYLYDIFSHDVDNYNISLKSYVDELLKIWFGDDYEKAKTLHDKYLNYALNEVEAKYGYYLINGRQVFFSGGRDLGGKGFWMQVWAKDVLNSETMYKS